MVNTLNILFFISVALFSTAGAAQETEGEVVSEEIPYIEEQEQFIENGSAPIMQKGDANSTPMIVEQPELSAEQTRRLEEIRSVLMNTDLATEKSNPTVTRASREVIDYIAFSFPRIFPFQIQSVLFTDEELEQIERYKGGIVASNPTDTEVEDAEELSTQFRVGSGVREISLAGILYISDNDWIIWMNGQKMTPTRLAPEIVDIEINKDFIRVDWYDSITNQIFPVKLKPHQRFNLDSRIFLPG